MMESKGGELLEFISYAEGSHNTFVSKDAMNLLEKYATEEICFVVVVGDQSSGKSFLCDKILNLSEIRGNHVFLVLYSFVEKRIKASISGQLLSTKRI